MSNRQTVRCLLACCCVFGATHALPGQLATGETPGTEQNAATELAAGFQQPPQAAKPSSYWLWLNGYANREYFDQELRAFAQQGVGGLCIFDMGARGEAQFQPPAGAPFLSEDSVESIAQAVQTARRYGLDVQLAACSSWDLGGQWVRPEHASMALYRSELRVEGPRQLSEQLPLPELAPQVPRHADGTPQFLRDVAVLAVPEANRLAGHEFIFRLPRGDLHRIDHVVLYNAQAGRQYGPLQLYAKDFAVAVSTTDSQRASFRDIVTGSLAPHTDAQRFDFDPLEARFVRLTIFNGHNPQQQQVQLAEFEIYSTDGVNIGGSKSVSYTRDAADLVWYSSESAQGGDFLAANLHDGAKSRPDGIWSFAGPPPLIIPDRNQILDITDQLDGSGRLTWSVPEGKWTVMRFVCANTGERLKVPSPHSDGLATDHFNAEATREFVQTIIDRLTPRLGNLREAGIKQLYLPSYEVVGAKWTPDFLDQFQHYRHYDMTQYLPVFAGCIVESEEQTRRFLYDFEKTLGELLVDAYYRTASATAGRAGLGIEAEAGGPGPPVHQVPVDALQALGAIDEMRGEFWPWRPDRNGLWVVKETASAAHIYGHRRVHMESFTGFHHWTDGPSFLKISADRAFCEGMNHVVWHTASHQPPEAGQPGWVYGAGTHLTPNIVWWPMARPFLDYLARCSYLLQQGLFVGDVCYYYGDQGSNFVPPKHVDPSLGFGYDYDVTNREVLLQRMTVQDGRIMLPDGMQYELLVLPQREDIDLQVLQKLEQMVAQGATIVGPQPSRAGGLEGYPQRDQQVRQGAGKLWGDCDGRQVTRRAYGKGQVIWGESLRDCLLARGVTPDFQFTSQDGDAQLDYIHRRTPTAEIYFVRNMESRPVRARATFRVARRQPELWCPVTGTRRPCGVYESDDRETHVPLALEPHGSVFVVFCEAPAAHLAMADPALEVLRVETDRATVSAEQNGAYQLATADGSPVTVQIDALPAPRELRGAWQLKFLSGRGAPEQVELSTLRSWTASDDPNVKYYAGLGRYEQSFEVPASWLATDRQVVLDLGNLWTVARVQVNGQDAGMLWQAPYRLDVTGLLKPGANALMVEVANTWSNRLVGDATLPASERVTRTNITHSGTPGLPWSEVPLRESGLLGPVRLVPRQVVHVSLSQ